MDGPLPKLCPAVALSRQDGHHSAVALLFKAALIQVSDYRLLGASGIHIEHICTFFVTFFSATIDGRNLMFGDKLHIGTPYRGNRFWTRHIPTSCLPKSGGIISEPLSSQFILFAMITPLIADNMI